MKEQNIAIYARVSKEDRCAPAGEGSVENQIALARARIAGDTGLCRMEISVYRDEGYSGTNMNRPAVKKLLADIFLDRIQVLVVKDLSRLSRNHLQLSELMENIFPRKGLRLICAGDGYDSAERDGGGLCEPLKSIFYEYYCQDISGKVQKSLEARKQSGKYAVSRAPFGYERDGQGGFVIQPEEAEVVRKIFALAAQGRNSAQIGVSLGRDTSFVWRILNNPVYLGRQVWSKTHNYYRNGFCREYRARKDWKWQQGSHLPIVSEEEYERAQQMQRHRPEGQKKRAERHMFCGMTKCAVCGRALCRKRRDDRVLTCVQRHEGKPEISVEELWRMCRRILCLCEPGAKSALWGAECMPEEEKRLLLRLVFRKITVGEKTAEFLLSVSQRDAGRVQPKRKRTGMNLDLP